MTPVCGSVPVKSKRQVVVVLGHRHRDLVQVRGRRCGTGPGSRWPATCRPAGCVSLPRRRDSASVIIRFMTALTVSAPYCSITREQAVAADGVGADLRAQVEPDHHRHPGAAHPHVGDVVLQQAVAHDLHRRGRQRLGEHVLRGRGERAEPDAAEVGLVRDRRGPAEELPLPEHGLEDHRVVLVQPAADPRVVAEEHVALGDAGVASRGAAASSRSRGRRRRRASCCRARPAPPGRARRTTAKSKSLASVTIGEPDMRLSASPISSVTDQRRWRTTS